MFNPIALYNPWTKASYSAVLLVQSNSSLHVNMILSPSGLITTHPAPAPSLDLEPSKNNFQNKDLFIGLSKKLIHFELSVWENFSTWDKKNVLNKVTYEH